MAKIQSVGFLSLGVATTVLTVIFMFSRSYYLEVNGRKMSLRSARKPGEALRNTFISSEHVAESEADRLSRTVRVFCLVMTTPAHHDSRAVHILATWGKRCTKIMFVSEGLDNRLQIIHVNVSTGRNKLTVKHRLAWDYVYRNHFDGYDWFYKVDDDAYVIMENLRYLLSHYNSTEPIYFGHHFKVRVKPNGYFSGGSGYALSREAVRRFGKRTPRIYREHVHSPNDDVEMGLSMQKLGVRPGDSRDARGLITFYVEKPEEFLLGPVPDWLNKYDKYPPLKVTDGVQQSRSVFLVISDL